MQIYKITNKLTGKVYVGQTVQILRKRWHGHKLAKRQCPLSSSIKKHGETNFIMEPICSVLKEEHLDELERYFIKIYDCIYPKGYNLTSGGNIGEGRRGMAPWNKGKKATEEARLNQSISHLGQVAWNKGLLTPEKVKRKQSLAKKNKHLSPSTEYKKGMTSIFKGKTHNENSKRLISENNGMSKAVYCVELNRYFPSIISIVKSLGINKNSLRRSIKAGTTHRTGLTFKKVK